MDREQRGRGRLGIAGEQGAEDEIDPEQGDGRDRRHRPDGNLEAGDGLRDRLPAPARRQFGIGLLHPAQGLEEFALDHLEIVGAAGRGAVNALEAQRQAGMHQFEQVVIDRRIGLGLVEHLEEAHAADALAEEAREHAVLRPDMPVVAGDVLDDVVGGRGDDVFRGLRGFVRDAGGADFMLEGLDRLADLAKELGEGRVGEVGAHPPEQEQERAGGAQQRVGVRREQLVAARQGLAAAGRRRGGLLALRDRRSLRHPFVAGAGHAGRGHLRGLIGLGRLRRGRSRRGGSGRQGRAAPAGVRPDDRSLGATERI